jgi:hypothetical protein
MPCSSRNNTSQDVRKIPGTWNPEKAMSIMLFSLVTTTIKFSDLLRKNTPSTYLKAV